jgi:hypothetical protein
MTKPPTYQTWKKYESPERWASYYTQIDEVLRFGAPTCLEIGVGNGIVGQALRLQGIELHTMDIDASLSPEHIGSVEKIPLPSASVDVVLCAEVLEHLPFDVFAMCLAEIARVARVGAVISLPHWGYTVRALIDIPGAAHIRTAWKLPIHPVHPPGGEHFWEIGKKGYPVARICLAMSSYFDIEKEWILPWMPYHHFFRLRKKRPV